MPKRSFVGSGSTSIRFQRTDTPSGRSTTPTTYGTGTPGMDWCTIDQTQSVPLRDSGISSNGPSAVHREHARRAPR